jgi:methionyl-tRNA formyltransferase
MKHKTNLKIVFLGTPEFGSIILEKLIKADFKPVLVVTGLDKPVGRKQVLTPSPVKIVAQKYKIPILQPEKISNLKSQISNLRPDLIVVAAYSQILPKEILDIPKYGSLNVHPSLLPKYRGSSPIQYAILNGDKETGVTIILLDEKIDHGDILAISNLKSQISNLTSGELSKELAGLGAELLVKAIPKWIKDEIKPRPQDDSKANYTKVFKKEDGKIDWKKSAEEIERQIRAFDPWPGAYTESRIKNQGLGKLKILKADILEQTKNGPFGPPGKTYLASNDKIAVQTGKDYLIIEELQPEGKRKMPAKEFLRGHLDFFGIILK